MILVREAHDLAKLDTACYKIGQSSQRSRIHRMRSNHETPDTIISYGAIDAKERSVPNNLHRDKKKNFAKRPAYYAGLTYRVRRHTGGFLPSHY